jgi:hypothetical protein
MKEEQKLEGIFTSVYQENLWGDDSSVSGPGSSLGQTIVIREMITELIRKYNIKTIVDAPCGDFFWMKEVLKMNINNINLYTGIDIVEGLIQKNQEKYGTDKICFIKSDLTRDIIPKADLIICRDCFLHLSYRNILNIINNFKLSGAEYLLVSTYTRHKNRNVYKYNVAGRAINLGKVPFKIKSKLDTINEDYHGQDEEYNDKSLILIRISSINVKQIFQRVLINEIFFIPGFLLLNLYRKVHRRTLMLIKQI